MQLPPPIPRTVHLPSIERHLRTERRPERTVRPAATFLLLLTATCTLFRASPAAAQPPVPPANHESVVVVPGQYGWCDTGIDVVAGEPLVIRADGSIFIGRSAKGKYDEPSTVGPEGTFLYNDKVVKREFPLASAGSGPAACFCLIGRIGASEPFYVGRSRSWKPGVSGRLLLGVNDFDCSDNTGQFVVSISKCDSVQPVAYEDLVPIDTGAGAAVSGCSVVVFYLDGLRPDVVREMAAMGHLPNINRLFIENGVWLNNAFTAFPSDTITSNGTMWTGCFSDRHGLKGQVSFSRRTLTSKSFLDPLGPSRSARLLAPQGLDRFLHETKAGSVQLIDGEDAARRFRDRQTSGIPALYAHLRQNGDDWSTGALPVMTEFPPVPWSRSLTKFVPYFQYHESWRYMDEANTDYAKNFLFERDSPVTIIWLPETDSVSHHDYSRGQFGATRRTIARADRLIGQMVHELEGRRRLERTYFILCSDHGHHGGRTTNLSHYDLADEFFYKPRLVAADGTWVGGGLGLSVRQHRFWNRHPNDRPIDFVFVDADEDGAARVYLPHGHFRTGNWYAKPRPADVLSYRIADNVAPVDLVASLTDIQAARPDGRIQYPVDLVLVKLTDDSMLISTHDRKNAVIHRKRNEKGKWVYKYTVVDHLQPAADGSILYKEVRLPDTDPLGLVVHLHPRLLEYYHDETEWLRLTTESMYPDSVVALSRHMLWQENLAEQEIEHAPDIVVTARRGWYFGIEANPGTTHGYPFADSMHASFFVSGPNVRRSSRIEEPCRLADLTPTILDMIGYRVETGDFDGHPLRNIYQVPLTDAATRRLARNDVGRFSFREQRAAQRGGMRQVVHKDQNEDAPERRPVYWDDIDLKAWTRLDSASRPEYEHKPVMVHNPNSPFDLHNFAYNVLALSDINVLRACDDVLSPFDNGRPILQQGLGWIGEKFHHSGIAPVADAADALDLTTTTIGDYSFTSVGNVKRMDGAIDWFQNRVNSIDRAVCRPFGREQSPGIAAVNKAIDRTQWWFWETYRVGQRTIAEWLDEGVLDTMEDAAAHSINRKRMQPAEIVVDPSQWSRSPTQTPPMPTPPPPAPPAQ